MKKYYMLNVVLKRNFNLLTFSFRVAFLFVILFSFNSVSAQSAINTLTVEFKTDDAVLANNPSVIPDVIVTVDAADYANATKLLISLGSTLNGSEHFSYVINIDGTNLPQGVTIQKVGSKIIVNTGTHSGVVQYYASAKLQYASGSYSDEIKINNVE